MRFGEANSLDLQVHKLKSAGSWDLDVSPGVEALSSLKPAVTKALSNAKYDKIIHVRQAAVKALHELEYIPCGTTTW